MLNSNQTPTFERESARSIIYLTLANQKMVQMVQEWRMLENETLSCHKVIQVEINSRHNEVAENRSARIYRANAFNYRERDAQKLQEYVRTQRTDKVRTLEDLVEFARGACKAVLRRKVARWNHRSVYWWTEQIAEQRKKSIDKKMRLMRSNARGEKNEELLGRHSKEKKDMKIFIKKSKEEHWRETCEELYNDIWGRGYQIAVKKTGLVKPAACGECREWQASSF